MQIKTHIQSRDELVAFGNRLGEILNDAARNMPWIVNLSGDEASGKELIALAIDQAISPEQYPDGITREMSADRALAPDQNRPTVFNNFRRPVYSTKERFDRALGEFADRNAGARVLVASNLERTFFGEFDYAAKGLDSDRLDVSVQVHKLPGSFERMITVTVGDHSPVACQLTPA